MLHFFFMHEMRGQFIPFFNQFYSVIIIAHHEAIQ